MQIFTKKEILFWALIVLTLVNVALLATILWHKPPRQKHGETTTHRMFNPGDSAMAEKGWQWQKKIGLEPEQHEKIQLIRKEYRKTAGELMEQMRQKHAEIFEELQKDNPDTIKLDAMAVESGQLQSKMRRESIKHILEIKSITTPEQQRRMMEFMRKHLSCEQKPGPPRNFRDQQRHVQQETTPK
ncbi:MAG: periplasmic heavy metal sensor [Bacteroidales bacterium]|nr:periplasmic heavy metal sensor [Bacteroidales bacterium]MDZ4204162.1 periplasmic heavy metal sensor [Bacteroidales bacterium]